MSTGLPGKLIKPDDVEGQIWTPIDVRDISGKPVDIPPLKFTTKRPLKIKANSKLTALID
jgi:hypothetical protein